MNRWWDEENTDSLDWMIDDYRIKHDCDYVDDEGYKVCGVCGERKETLTETRVVWGRTYGGLKVYRDCKCDRENRERLRAEKRAELEYSGKMYYVREMAKYSLIDTRFKESTFENFKPQTPNDEKVLKACLYYVDHFDEMKAKGAGLIFYGPPGTGKTFVAACIANALMAKFVPVLATNIVRLTAGKFGDELNDTLAKMNEADLLVLDDLGAERNTEYMAEQVFNVIDARYAARKPMIITTNLTSLKSPEIKRERIFDRIKEVCKPIRITGASKRTTINLQNQAELWAELDT